VIYITLSIQAIQTEYLLMRSLMVLTVAAFGLAGCAQNPNEISNDYINDPKYNTEGCQEMRIKALDYNDRVLGRVGTGLALGLFLGPFGIPLSVMADANQNEERKAWSREVHLACSSDPLPDILK
jgi:hypothetical protein